MVVVLQGDREGTMPAPRYMVADRDGRAPYTRDSGRDAHETGISGSSILRRGSGHNEGGRNRGGCERRRTFVYQKTLARFHASCVWRSGKVQAAVFYPDPRYVLHGRRLKKR